MFTPPISSTWVLLKHSKGIGINAVTILFTKVAFLTIQISQSIFKKGNFFIGYLELFKNS